MTNTAKIETEKLARDARTDHVKSLVTESGKMLEMEGFRHTGSAVVHFYEGINPVVITEKKFAFGCITMLEGVEEGQADAGLKSLRNRMMNAYGRQTERRVGENEIVTESR